MFKHEKTQEDLLELKKVLSNYLFNKAIRLTDKVYEEKGYTAEDIKNWKNEHTRINRI